MLSLAPIKYLTVLGQKDSPIGRLEYGKILVRGLPMYHANAFLKESLSGNKTKNEIYDNADGSGTHTSPMQARYVAISEAIERWALYKVQNTEHAKEYGFDIDNSSCGMAAFPGVFKSQARSKALSEAAERFCLVSWWAGRLTHRDLTTGIDGIDGIEISNPISQDKVTLLWKQNSNGFYSYGFAADKTLTAAIWKASIELDRTESALRRHYRENPNFGEDDLSAINQYFERRMVYYSMAQGHELFKKRLETTVKNEIKPPVQPIIDSVVEGPWSKYATVWRVLYQMPSKAYKNKDSFFFYW